MGCLGIGVGVAAVVLMLGATFRGPLLRGMASAWVVSDALEKADAIVILAGSIESRPHTAARLYHEQWAPNVMLTDIPAREGFKTPGEDYTSGTLVMDGVPHDAIVIRRSGVRSTHDEAIAVRNWAWEVGATRLLVVTDPFHTRRVKWLFTRVMANSGVECRIVAAEPVDYKLDAWWQSEVGLIEFNNEIIKYLLYRWKY